MLKKDKNGSRAPGCNNRVDRNSNNISKTILQHNENPGIVRTVYSGIFRDIQPRLGKLMHIMEY